MIGDLCTLPQANSDDLICCVFCTYIIVSLPPALMVGARSNRFTKLKSHFYMPLVQPHASASFSRPHIFGNDIHDGGSDLRHYCGWHGTIVNTSSNFRIVLLLVLSLGPVDLGKYHHKCLHTQVCI